MSSSLLIYSSSWKLIVAIFILKASYCSDSVVVSTLVRNHEVAGSNPTPARFESNVSVLPELSTNCTMVWVADRQVRAMLYATLAVS